MPIPYGRRLSLRNDKLQDVTPVRPEGDAQADLLHPTFYRVCMVRRGTAREKLRARRQVCANVFGLLMEIGSPGHDELRAYLSL
jgi:hypothetical protein